MFEKAPPGIPVVLVQDHLAGGIETDMAHADGSDGLPFFELFEPDVHGPDVPGALCHNYSQVLSLKRKGDRVPSEKGVSRHGEFAEGPFLEAEKTERETLRLSWRMRGLDKLMKVMAKGKRIGDGGLRSGG